MKKHHNVEDAMWYMFAACMFFFGYLVGKF